MVYIIDDLERAGIEVEEVLGCINEMTEHEVAKVIILANEEEIYGINDFTKSLQEKKQNADTKEAETADQYIEKTTHEIGRKYKVTVATSDALEQVIVMGQGAYRISARDFYEEVERTEKQIREINERERGEKRNYLLDYAKEEDAREMEKVRLGKTTEK